MEYEEMLKYIFENRERINSVVESLLIYPKEFSRLECEMMSAIKQDRLLIDKIPKGFLPHEVYQKASSSQTFNESSKIFQEAAQTYRKILGWN